VGAEAQMARWRFYLKSEKARKVPFNTTLTLDTMDLDHLHTVQARVQYANCTITMVAVGS
jgi:hypothetical protein